MVNTVMNAYFCDAGEHEATVETIDYWERREIVGIVDVVVAKTRGQAKMLFIDANQDAYIDWCTPMSIRKIEDGIDEFTPHVVRYGDALYFELWRKVQEMFD